jgi:hypothetical protein
MKKRFVVFVTVMIMFMLGGSSENRLRQRMIAVGNGMYRFESSDGAVRYKDMSLMEATSLAVTDSIPIDTFVVNLRTLDTTMYPGRLTYWDEIPIANNYAHTILVGDVNRNGNLEMYGYTQSFNDYNPRPIQAYELDADGIFRGKFTYPDTFIMSQAIYDVDRDGMDEIMLSNGARNRLFRKSSPTSYADSILFECNPFVDKLTQMDNPTFGDFDNDGLTELAAILSVNAMRVFILRYNGLFSRFDSIYAFTPPNFYIGGLVAGDFDQDCKTDFVTGSSDGEVYVVEHQKQNQYEHVWTGKVAPKNAFLFMKTNDIDGNGKPEFWVGSDGFYNGSTLTRYTCFESDGENSYKPVARIDFPTYFSLFAGNCLARDVDHDGVEELLICFDGNAVIIKFCGSLGKFAFKVLYHKHKDYINPNSIVFGATLADIDNDKNDELLFSMAEDNGSNLRSFTQIYKLSVPTSVALNNVCEPRGYNLQQNYPNPFNPSTMIAYELGKRDYAVMKVFDVSGKEIRQFINQELPAGNHQTIWDGKDRNGTTVASGVYFISLQTNHFSKTIKALLIR